MKSNRITNLGAATLENYVETRRQLLRQADELTVRIARMEPIRTMDEMNALLDLDRDRGLVMEMIASSSYVIEWLETGRRPGNRRGIERRSGAQREVPTDPARLPSASLWERAEAERPSDEAERFRLEAALRGLTERERSCYTLARGETFSHSEIAAMLNISKSSVGTYIIRAQRKVDGNIDSIHILVG